MHLKLFVSSLIAGFVTQAALAQYTAIDIGGPQPPGSVTPSGNGYNITAGGGDIGGTADRFTFNYQTTAVTGDFDLKIRISSLSQADTWTKAGLMGRASLTTNSAFAAAFATPGGAGAYFSTRATTGTNANNAGSFPVNYPDTWLRLRRVSNQFTGYASFDGNSWAQLGTANLALPNALFVGMAVTSRTNGVTTTAEFRDSAPVTNGTVVPYVPEVEPPGPSTRRTPFVFTEIMYNPFPSTNASGQPLEFVELYNANPFFEEIGGYRLSGDIDFTFPENTFIQGNGYVVIARDPAAVKAQYGLGDFNGVTGVFNGAYSNALPGTGTLRLRNKEDAILLEVPYSSQPPWPAGADGAGHSLVLARPSYGEGYAHSWAISDRIGGSPGRYDTVSFSPLRSIVINELFANSEPPDIDFVELYNHSNVPVDVGGCALSDEAHTNKFVIPSPTIIPPRGFLALQQTELGFGLSSGGETIYFRSADGTRVLDAVRFEAQGTGISSGRSPDGAREFYPLKSRTPGAANAGIFIHDIVINEIMYRPISTSEDDEYVELFNQGTNTISLAGWRFIAGINYTFPSNAVLAPNSYLVVAENVARLLTNYPNLNSNNTYGNFGGSLANRGERLALARPDINITTNGMGQVSTNTVYVVVDEVTYLGGGNWPQWANEGGSSMELIDPRSNHRLGHNWADSDETQKALWTTVEATGAVDRGSGAADWIEVQALGEADFLVDDIEVLPGGGGNSLAPANSNFQGGLGNWILRGTHIRSSWQATGGVGSGGCLHIRTTARGDTMGSRTFCTLATPVPTTAGSMVTLRAKVRWLRGWPEALLRLRGNWMEAYGRLNLPSNLGTPGLPNSRAAANAAPAIFEVKHAPVVPAANEPVVVTARVHDPDPLASVMLKYRQDGMAYTSLPMRDDGTGGDAMAGDGVFSATIPTPGVATLYAFQVTAADTLGAAGLYPVQLENFKNPFECLVRFGDPVVSSGFGTYRQWMTQSNITDFVNRPPLSNEKIYETFVYGNFRAIYNASMKWSASPYHQWGNPGGGTSSNPTNTDGHYVIETPLDDLFLGTENINKVHSPGNSPFDDVTIQREQIGYWTARQLGLPWNYRRFVNMFFNGNRRGGTTRLMEDTTRAGDDFVDAYFPDDRDGHLYKLQPWFEQPDPGGGANNIAWCALNKVTVLSNNVPVHKTARYRQNYLVRAANATANDFQPVFELIDAAQPTNNLPAQYANLSAIANMEEWFRVFALAHSVGDWDHFGYQNSQNMYAYKPQNGKWTLMIWDFNILLGNSGSHGPDTGNLFNINSQDTVMPFVFRNPPFTRMYFRALKEIANSVWVTNRYIPVLDAKYNAILASGVTPNSPDPIKTYIASMRTALNNYFRPLDPAAFRIKTPDVIDTTNNFVVITGEAPFAVKFITINGIEYPLSWTTTTNFSIFVPLSDATNLLALQAHDVNNQPISGFTTNVTVTFTGQVPPPESSLVINEIMYNPATPDASFVEIYNNSDFAYELSGWRVNGIDYTFPDGATISNRQHLVLAKNPGAFAAAFGSAVLYDIFDGNLDRGGETLSLEKPVPIYTTNGLTIVTNFLYTPVDRVRYDDDPPWPAIADGQGPSLQLVDPAQDNARVSNWASGRSWQRVSRTGNIVNATNLLLWITMAGNAYIDDISLVGPGGTNLVVNGDFESGALEPWIVGTNYSSSVVVDTVSHSGQRSLFLNGAGPGGSFPQNLLQQVIGASVQTSNVYTLSYYVLFHTNTVTVNMRCLPGNNLTTNAVTAAIQASPGLANLFPDTLPPYDPLWLNEIQINNLTGPTDNNGQREPWVELFNSGNSTLDLSGYYLADNYSNLTQWQFPSGTTLAPGGFRIVWLDGEPAQTSGANLHANFRANSPTGSVALVRMADDNPQITDYLNYPVIAPDLSYGSAPDGQPFNRTILFSPTPGASNLFRTVNVFINEWMAGNTNFVADPADMQFDDWFELYNAGSEPVDLGGYWLTDNLNNRMDYQVPTNGQYVIPPGGFLLVWADGEENQNSPARPELHVSFQLSRTGESIGLFAPDGQTAIDTITFGDQTNDVSQGRFADGADSIYFMTTPTPGAPNTIGLGNTPPSLALIGDKVVTLGQTLSFTASASDPDFPAQDLMFSLLPGSPAGAAINATSGLFTWTPGAAQAPSTNSISIRVADSGVPPLSATRTFLVTVRLPPTAMISNSGNGQVLLSFDALNGKSYRIEYKNNLDDAVWLQLGQDVLASGNRVTVNDSLGASPQRFYRIVQLD